MINRSQRIKKKYWVGVVRFTRQKKKPRRNFFPAFNLRDIWFFSDIFSHWLLRNLCYDSRHETAKFGENKIGGISRLFRIVAVFISFLSQVEVGPLRNINFGIDYDAGNPFDTKITEPRVQTRLCLAGMNRAMSNCTPLTKRQNIYWFRLFAYKMILLLSLWKSVKNDCFSK